MRRAAQQYRTYYIEEPIFGDADFLETSLDSSGVMICVPHITIHLSAEESQARTARLIDQLVQQEGLRTYILWVYTPMELPVVSHLSPVLTVYDCMDELSGFRFAPSLLQDRERQLFQQADVVFTGGYHLWEKKRLHHPNVYPFPSSVDVAHFRQARLPQADPPDQASLPAPRLGFYGVLDERFDSALISELARRRPEWSIVLIGPTVKVSAEELPHEPNVIYLGQKRYEELPAYLSHWDVAMLPFARNEATEFISPTKTPEYLAAGVPVVSTAIHDVVHPYGDMGLLQIADDAAGFEAAIQDLLATRHQDVALRRQAQADLYVDRLSWDATWCAMQARMTEALHRNSLPEHVEESTYV
ncbi:glycosyltransferase (plasmid) [Deinococcus sp. KNUC1210]|uniref:glycosyltransferase n=1 Tax=Deinococcus sp. KNUC1210 TaxID=2917691 RepID=UPI001EF12101|nr:glycosyltransferase [Deinococcus sp. KNUC1210]ULH17068.1 glycosyltransferase [Deinococcus sp. KNUC1210]